MRHRFSDNSAFTSSPFLRLVIVAFVLGLAIFGAWQRQPSLPPGEPTRIDPGVVRSNDDATVPSLSSPASRTRIDKQTIRDEHGSVVFRGDIDVAATLKRISRGERLPFSHDGTRFQNRERRLPQQPAGYYHEFVHPTSGLSGPGPQRIIVGREGEIYYTPDHYRTFQRLDE